MFNKNCFLGISLFCFLSSIPAFANAGQKILENISPKRSAQLIEENRNNSDFILLDMRTSREFKGGHIDGAQMIDYYSKSFKQKLNSLDKNKTYLIYCRSSNRTGKAMKIMDSLGFKKVYNMEKGLMGWRYSGFKLVRTH